VKAIHPGGKLMSTTHPAIEAPWSILPGERNSFFRQCWRALQERLKRQKLRAALYELNDADRKDMGISRGAIEYVASNPSVEPRDVRADGLRSG